ncbi:MAG: acyltransferase family protein [Pseudobdellovibrio sp.]|nr:acyltransferase family protein [Pseudobdellovibrio sp.]
MRFTNIDIIRVVSLALVIFSHYVPDHPAFLGGTQGVVLFFFISGYCISMTSQKRKSFKEFWFARWERLLPVLFVSGLFITIVKMSLVNVIKFHYTSLPEMFNTFFCLPLLDIPFLIYRGSLFEPDYQFIDGAFWSLLVEFRFYFLFGVLYFFFKMKKMSSFVLLPFALISIWTSQYFDNRLNDFFMYLTFFSFGNGYYHFKTDSEKTFGAITMLISFSVFIVLSLMGVDHLSLLLSKKNSMAFYGVLFPLFLILMELPYNFSERTNSWITKLAVLSYPAYLIHQDLGLMILKLADTYGEGVRALATIVIVGLLFIISNYIQVVSDRLLLLYKKKKTPG